jgi:hypothetical protein
MSVVHWIKWELSFHKAEADCLCDVSDLNRRASLPRISGSGWENMEAPTLETGSARPLTLYKPHPRYRRYLGRELLLDRLEHARSRPSASPGCLMYCVDVLRGPDKRFTRPDFATCPGASRRRSLSMKSETDRMARYSHYSTGTRWLFQALRADMDEVFHVDEVRETA